MTELIIKVDDDFLREAKIKGMESQYELVRCKDCEYLEVCNTEHTYALCHKHHICFKPFEEDTRQNYCSWAKMKGGTE